MPTASFSDRHLEIADGLRDIFADRLPPAAEVSRAYDPDVDSKSWSGGRTVWVFPTAEEDTRRLTRTRVLTDYTFAVVTGRRYEPPAEATGEPVPVEWTDFECGWVHQEVYTPLNDAVRLKDRLIPTAVPQACKLTAKYDPVRLANKIFWSVVEVTFREERRA